MCELFGISSEYKVEINTYLNEFFSHGQDHPNGWGLAIFHSDSVNLEKEPVCSNQSSYLKERLKSDIYVKDAIAHIRLATRGVEKYENTHPFIKSDETKRIWTLAHNGTIFDNVLLDSYCDIQQGQTDSERILYFIVERMKDFNDKERFDCLDDIVCTLSSHNKLNLLIYDGSMLYVHTNYKHSLYKLQKEKTVIFSTQPLDSDDWKEVDLCQLFAYKDGKMIYKGTVHNQEYVDNEKDMKYLFMDWAYL